MFCFCDSNEVNEVNEISVFSENNMQSAEKVKEILQSAVKIVSTSEGQNYFQTFVPNITRMMLHYVDHRSIQVLGCQILVGISGALRQYPAQISEVIVALNRILDFQPSPKEFKPNLHVYQDSYYLDLIVIQNYIHWTLDILGYNNSNRYRQILQNHVSTVKMLE